MNGQLVIAAAHVAQEDRPFLHSARRDLEKLRNLRGKRGVMIRTVTAGQKVKTAGTRHKVCMHTRANHLRHTASSDAQMQHFPQLYHNRRTTSSCDAFGGPNATDFLQPQKFLSYITRSAHTLKRKDSPKNVTLFLLSTAKEYASNTLICHTQSVKDRHNAEHALGA